MVDDPLIEAHLDRIAARLRFHGSYRDRIMAELRAHLEDAVDAGVAQGRTRAEATEVAIKELGDPTELASRFVPQEATLDRVGLGLFIAAVGLGILALRVVGDPPTLGGLIQGRLGAPVLLLTALAALAAVGVVIARFREQLGVPGSLGAAALATAGLAMVFGGFYGPLEAHADLHMVTSVWWLGFVALVGSGVALLAWTAWARGLVSAGPLLLGGAGLVFVFGSGLGITRLLDAAGLMLLAGAAVGAGIALRRERPLV